MNADRLLAHYEKIANAPDAIPLLRRFVLDLAVRGKLVEQDPNDESAEELLTRISTEKVRAAKKWKIRIKGPLPAFEPSELEFELPASWSWVRIRNVTSDRGQMVPDQDFTYVDDVTAINKEVGRIEEPKVTAASDAPSRARKIVCKGDVLYSCVRPYLLNIAIVDTDISPPPIASTAFAVLNGFGLVLPKYQWIVLRSPYFVACVEQKMRGQAYPAINDSDFALLPFPLPPLAEQHRIVAKVDELMALCDGLDTAREEQERTRDRLATASLARLNAPDPDRAVFQDHAAFAIDNLIPLTTRPDQIKALRQTILNLAVRGKLVEQDANDVPVPKSALSINEKRRGQDEVATEQTSNLPTAWAWRTIGTIAEQVTDGEHATPPRISEQQVPLVTAKNVRDGFMDYAQTDWVSIETADKAWKRCRPQVNDLLLVCVGATIGRLTVLREPKAMVLVRSVSLIRPGPSVNSEFLERAIRSQPVQTQIWASVKAAAQPCLYINRTKSLLVPIPPLAEQHRIVAKVDELMALCDQLEASLAAGNDSRRRLLQALLHESLAPSEEESGNIIAALAQEMAAKLPTSPKGLNQSKPVTASTLPE